MDSQLTIGVITFSLTGERTDLANNYHKEVVGELKSYENVRVVEEQSLCLETRGAISVAKRIEKSGVDCLIMVIGTWTYASMVVTVAQNTHLPFLIWSILSEKAFSLVGGAIIHGSLNEIGLFHKYIYGEPRNKNVLQEIITFAQASRAVRKL